MTERSDSAIRVSTRTLRRWGIAIVVAIVAIAIGAGLVALIRGALATDTLATAINHHDYQYVYLTSGESYFGKLSSPGGGFYYMRHVYTLTTQSTPRSATPLKSTLIKLTNEIHGPEDLIVINRSQIVYMENLRPTGCATILMTTGGPCR